MIGSKPALSPGTKMGKPEKTLEANFLPKAGLVLIRRGIYRVYLAGTHCNDPTIEPQRAFSRLDKDGPDQTTQQNKRTFSRRTT